MLVVSCSEKRRELNYNVGLRGDFQDSLFGLEWDERWDASQSGCWEFPSWGLDGWADWDTWSETTLFCDMTSCSFGSDWLELDPRIRLRLGVGTTPALRPRASDAGLLLSDWMEVHLEWNVLFFGTGLTPTEEPSDVREPPEVGLLCAGWLFSGYMGPVGNNGRKAHSRLCFNIGLHEH